MPYRGAKHNNDADSEQPGKSGVHQPYRRPNSERPLTPSELLQLSGSAGSSIGSAVGSLDAREYKRPFALSHSNASWSLARPPSRSRYLDFLSEPVVLDPQIAVTVKFVKKEKELRALRARGASGRLPGSRGSGAGGTPPWAPPSFSLGGLGGARGGGGSAEGGLEANDEEEARRRRRREGALGGSGASTSREFVIDFVGLKALVQERLTRRCTVSGLKRWHAALDPDQDGLVDLAELYAFVIREGVLKGSYSMPPEVGISRPATPEATRSNRGVSSNGGGLGAGEYSTLGYSGPAPVSGCSFGELYLFDLDGCDGEALSGGKFKRLSKTLGFGSVAPHVWAMLATDIRRANGKPLDVEGAADIEQQELDSKQLLLALHENLDAVRSLLQAWAEQRQQKANSRPATGDATTGRRPSTEGGGRGKKRDGRRVSQSALSPRVQLRVIEPELREELASLSKRNQVAELIERLREWLNDGGEQSAFDLFSSWDGNGSMQVLIAI